MALDLARMDKRWGFSIMVMKWKVFLEGYLFSTINCDCDGTFEVDRKKMDIDAFIQGESSNKRKDIAFIRIGVLHAKSPRKIEMQKDSDGRMITTPPRLSGLCLQQSSFRRLIEPILWNYILDNDLEEGKEVDESSSDEEVDSVVSLTPPEPPYSVAASMTPVKSATPVHNDQTSNKYPHLSRALDDEDGYFDPADPSVIKSMQGLLQEIKILLSTKYELNL